MNLSGRGNGLRSVLVIVLCALFFLLAMGITLLGSGIYRDTVSQSDANFTQRTALSYLVNQVRRGDIDQGVALGEFGDGDAIFLQEEDYSTILYCYDGQLRELYMETGLGLLPEDGVAVLPLSSLSISAQGSLISITVSGDDGMSHTTSILPRCGLIQGVAA